MTKKLLLIELVLFITASFFLVFDRSLYIDKSKSPNNDTSQIGNDFPDIAYDNFSKADLLGTYSIVNFFASWCTTCILEHPLLNNLGKKINIYGISWDKEPKKLQEYLEKHGNPYKKIALDSDSKLIIELGVSGVPESLLVAPDGKIIYRIRGPLTDEIVNNEILPLIK